MTTPTPAWRDKPPCPGLYVLRYKNYAGDICKVYDQEDADGYRARPDYRWFGPIPTDPEPRDE